MRQTAIRLTLLVVGVTSTATAAAPPQASPAVRSGEVTAGRLAAPLAFEPNRGQAAGDVEYLARGEGYTVFLRPREATLALRHTRRGEAGLVRVWFEGAGSPAALEPLDPLPGRSNYLVGHDPAQWLTGVPHYGRVRSRGAATGIDLVFYGRERQLEYDLVVSPRANPKRLRMRVEGATVEGPNAEGDLVLRTPAGDLLLRKPVAFQLDGASQHAVAVSYRVRRRHEVALEVAGYDAARPLVIDPVLSYSTYLGGFDADEGRAIAVDAGGNAYVTGSAASNDFPVRPDVPDTVPFPRLLCVDFGCAYQLELRGGKDAFVTKFSSTGTLVYSTYLGGTADELGNAIAVDADGNAYVAGETSSLDFPATTGAYQTRGSCPTCTANSPAMLHPDAFVAKLNAEGTALVYATYLGGGHEDSARGIAVDPSGRAHVVGETRSSDFPTTDGAAQPALGGGTCFSDPCADAFVASLEADGSALSYATYLGGAREDGARAVATDEDGDAYVAGSTASSDFPTQGTCEARAVVPGHVEIVCFRPLQAALNSTGDPIGDVDAFVSKLAADGRIVWSTYLGGTHRDVANGIATRTVTSTKNGVTSSLTEVYVAGETLSADFPVNNAFQNVHAGGNTDAFVAKLSSTGSSLLYSTFLGGSGASSSGSSDTATAVAVDALGSAYAAGYTASADRPDLAYDTPFPVMRPAQPTCGGCGNGLDDAFVAKLDPAGSLSYATYLGGTGEDRASGIAVDGSGTAYVTGTTLSFYPPDFPTVSAAQPAAGGGVSDAFAAKLVDHVAASTDLAVTQSASPDPAVEGAELAYSVVVTNNGSTDASGVALLETLPVEADFVSAAASTGGCALTAAKKLMCNLGTLAAGTQATVTILVVLNKMAP
jgi:uncharacterized repeat protein (TIGR01451 family)